MIADVADSHKISDIVRQVNRLLPDPSLKHLKKIRRTDDGLCQILLGKDELVQENLQRLQSLSLLNLKSCDIPARQPLTRAQFEECKLLWPTSFHEEKYVKKCLEGRRFSEKELHTIRQVADRLISRKRESGRSVTLIVDDDVILADESDDTDRHPLHHSAILAVDTIARKRVTEKAGSGGYVCTGLDAFTSQECCLMCAMALLHSRIGRIFFLKDGGRGCCPPDQPFTRMKLHANESLNHGFEVWTVEVERSEEEN